MKIVRFTDKDFAARIREATSDSSLFDAEIESRTKAILHDVFVRGDDAVLDFTEKFDGAKLTADQLAVTQANYSTPRLRPMIITRGRWPKRRRTSRASPKNPNARAGIDEFTRRKRGREV